MADNAANGEAEKPGALRKMTTQEELDALTEEDMEGFMSRETAL